MFFLYLIFKKGKKFTTDNKLLANNYNRQDINSVLDQKIQKKTKKSKEVLL